MNNGGRLIHFACTCGKKRNIQKEKVSIIIFWGHYVGRHLSNVKSFQFLQQKEFVLIINNNQTLSLMAFTQNKFFQLEKSTEWNNKFTWTSIAIIYSFILVEKPNAK